MAHQQQHQQQPMQMLDLIDDLALRRVAALLDGRSLARLACCSRALRALAGGDDALWAALVRRRFGSRHLLPPALPPPALRSGDLLDPIVREAAEAPSSQGDGEGAGWAFFPGVEPAYPSSDGEDEEEEGALGGGARRGQRAAATVPLLPLLRAAARGGGGGGGTSRRRGRGRRPPRHPVLTPLLVRQALEEADARGYPAVTFDVRDDDGGGGADSEESEEEDAAAAGGDGGGEDGGAGGAGQGGEQDEGEEEEEEEDDDDDCDPFSFLAAPTAAPLSTEAGEGAEGEAAAASGGGDPPGGAPAGAAPVRVVSALLVPREAFPPPRRPPIMRRLSYHPLAGTFVRRAACEELGLEPPPPPPPLVCHPLPWPPGTAAAAPAPPPPLSTASPAPPGDYMRRFRQPQPRPQPQQQQQQQQQQRLGWVYFPGWRLPPVASVWPRELLGAAYFGALPALLEALTSQHARAARGGGGPSALAQVPQAVEAATGRYHGFAPAPPPPGTTPEAAAMRRGTPLPPQAAWTPSPRWSEGVYVRADVAADRGFLQRREWEALMATGERRAATAGAAAGAAAVAAAGAQQQQQQQQLKVPHRAIYARLSRLVQPAARADSCAWLDGAHAAVVSRTDATERARLARGWRLAEPLAAGRLGPRIDEDGGGGGGDDDDDDEDDYSAGRPPRAGPVLRILNLCWLDVVVRVPGVPVFAAPAAGAAAAAAGAAAAGVSATAAPTLHHQQQQQQRQQPAQVAVVWRIDLSAGAVSSPITFSARQQRDRRDGDKRRRRQQQREQRRPSEGAAAGDDDHADAPPPAPAPPSAERTLEVWQLHQLAKRTAIALARAERAKAIERGVPGARSWPEAGAGTAAMTDRPPAFGRWTEFVVGPLTLEPTSTGYATVVARCHAHDGAWKRGLDVDSVLVRPWSAAEARNAAPPPPIAPYVLLPEGADPRGGGGGAAPAAAGPEANNCALM